MRLLEKLEPVARLDGQSPMDNAPRQLDVGEPLPTFLIPVGTQVVLKVAKRVPGSNATKPAGSIGIVAEAPATNRRPYVIRFVDGVALRVKFADLAVRRREVADELVTPGEDMRRYVIFRVTVGSRAFGLAGEKSDEDRRGVYLPPAELTWSLFKPPEQVEFQSEGVEEVDWELEKFVRLALQANPNLLEALWSPHVLHADETGQELRSIRQAVLSRHLFKTYSGYVLSQFRLMKDGYAKKGVYRAKHAMHLIRLLYSGIHAVRTGEILVDVGEHRNQLLEIRGGTWPLEEVRRLALELNDRFQQQFATTCLPERPDYDRVNRFLIAARRRMVCAT
jgi:predicted nucleotidyltransferase